MFGDLFEEDGDGFSSSTPGTGVKGRECEPPPPRGKIKLCGIKNQGGTCYLNSLIQTLLFTPEEELFRLGPDELGCLADEDKPEAKARVIPLELQRLFSHLLLVDEQTASTTDLTDSFGWTNNEEMGQQDVQELNRILFSALESSLVGTSGSSLIHRLYHGTLVNQITCKECGNISERQEDFLDLTLSVRGVSGLEEALWNMFVEEEMFEGNNLYRCSRCYQLVRAAKSAKLRKLPPFLTISLLRFNFDFAKCERYKETGRYVFPLTFNLRPFCEQNNWPDSESSYELFSVIIHKGGCYGGHYHVYIKDIDQLGHWESENSVDTEDPLSVLTVILAQEESKCVLVDQLGQKLMNKTGMPWSKKYKKQYGTISKFLQKHPEVFMLVSNGTRVALKAAGPATTEPSPREPVSSASANNSPDNTELETAGDTEGPDGCHWFNLNDSTVTAISETDIEKQFQGKESAYMLFYRKTTMKRPPEAIGNLAYKVPPHLVEMVQEENARLQQRRCSNSVEVRLHLAPHYHWHNGALHPISPDEDSIITVTFDRRNTVGDLRLAIYQMQDLWEGDMALTLAKNVPAGLHLYDTLTDDQISLYSAGVSNGSDLFVWNGRKVSGVAVKTGMEWEPVLLTVLHPSVEELGCGDGSGVEDTDGSGLVCSMKGFAGGATLGTVLEALGPQEAFLCQEQSRPGANGGGASGWRIFPPRDMLRTLRELSLKDGDALLLLQPEELDSRCVHTICACVNVMQNAYHKFSVMRKYLFSMQLFLYFSVGLAPSVGQELEIIVEESLTVKESWHLRRVDWCEEIGEPLMDENASLKEAKVIHGDTLVLVEGRLPPKVCFQFWMISYVETFQTAVFHLISISGLPQTVCEDVHRRPGVRLSESNTDKEAIDRIHGRLKLCFAVRKKHLSFFSLYLCSLKDLLLRVQMGVPGEKAYYPSEEFLWDVGRDGTPRGLYATLASRYGLTPDNLLLAKHLPDKHTWMPISNWTQHVSKRKKKRKAESLQAAPFYLKDGDIIGVKNLLIDNNKEFTILEDEIGQQRITANHNTRCILLFCSYCHSPILQDIGLSVFADFI
uniref:Ubiquitin carboxyl-terminal hydrolase 40-like n=1 Tax=Sinocyclocheilus anshuiensis TaxID=1608454 RepID=A0A671K8T7_9TELE